MSLDYASAYGPTTDDRIRLGDTGLVVEVESDSQQTGEEFLAGFAKTARDGMHLKAARVRDTCDLVISNVVVIDAVLGIRKVSIGIREGRISGIGRAGNPDTLDAVDVVVGTGTTIVSGEGLIATAGAIDTHVHLLSPRIMEASLASGVTTVIGQEFGPVWGVGVNSPGPCGTPSTLSTPGRSTSAFSAGVRPRTRVPVWRPWSRAGPAGSRCTKTWARTRGRWTRPCGWPRSTMSRWRCTPTGSTSPFRLKTLWRFWTAGRSTLPHRGLRRWARAERAADGRRAERHRFLDQPDVAVRPGRGGRALSHDRRRARAERGHPR